VIEPSAGGVALSDGTDLPCDLLVWAGGPRVSEVLAASGLGVDPSGAVWVDDRLRCLEASDVFAAGDCARVAGRPPTAKAGVYAIREGPILHHNLLACARGGELTVYRPAKRILLILNLGDSTGLATRGSWVWSGRLPLRLKRWLDARFLRRYAPGW